MLFCVILGWPFAVKWPDVLLLAVRVTLCETLLKISVMSKPLAFGQDSPLNNNKKMKNLNFKLFI